MQGFSLERLKKRIMVQIRSLFNNWGLKIVSLIVAIFLWLFVTNYQDPETVLTVNNVPVKLLHTEAVKSEGKIYIVLDDSDTIPVVTINAPRSIVDKLEADNVIATADLEDMNPDYTVPIMITTNKYSDSISNISGSIRSVSLSVEDEARAIFPIEASVAGSAADGYQMGQVAMDQNQVRVTGPKSEVERVKSAGVIVDISDSDRTVSTNAEIHLYDEDGRDIDIDKNLTLNIDKVMVRVEVLPLKVVPIKIAVSGKPVEGYRMTGETAVEPGQVLVAGKKSTLDAVSAISIPSSELNVTGRTNDLVKTFDLRNYLPTGVELAEGESETVKVTIEIVETGDE
jgi:YbbR domain-containing protein